MTNEQLAVYLRSIVTQLDAAIDVAEAAIPEDVERTKTILGPGNYVALCPLLSVVEQLRYAADLLARGRKEEP